MARGINTIAKRERLPRATAAAQAIRAGLQELEDEDITEAEERALARIVRERDTPGVRWLTEKQADALFKKLHRS